MKLGTVMMVAGGMLLPVLATAQPPRPEEAVAKLQLDDALRTQVLAVFEQARSKHEALRTSAESQRAANDEAFCAIRRDTRSALAKLLSAEQMAALDAEMRPREHRDGPPMRDGRGPLGRRPEGAGPRGEGQRERGMDGPHGPRPPRCDDAESR